MASRRRQDAVLAAAAALVLAGQGCVFVSSVEREYLSNRSLLDGKNVNSAKTLLDALIGNTGGEFLAESATQTGLTDFWRELTGEAFGNVAEAFK